MTEIENHNTTQVNLVVSSAKPLDLDSIDIPKLKTILSSIYEGCKPIITQFPEILVIFDPNNQISINVIKDQNIIIVADQRVTPYSGREMDNFIKLADKCIKTIFKNKADIKNYGVNILSNFDLKDVKNSGDFLKSKFLKEEIFNSIPLKSAGLNIVFYDEKERARFSLKLDPVLGTDLEPTKSVKINQNAHFANEKIPELEEFRSICLEIYDGLSNLINKLIN